MVAPLRVVLLATLAGLFITSTLLHLGEDINLLIVSIPLLVPKVNLKLNLNILVMLNVSGVRDMDIMLQSVQTRES
jgi:hypothetical protein